MPLVQQLAYFNCQENIMMDSLAVKIDFPSLLAELLLRRKSKITRNSRNTDPNTCNVPALAYYTHTIIIRGC